MKANFPRRIHHNLQTKNRRDFESHGEVNFA
jgi:hypothetical protein